MNNIVITIIEFIFIFGFLAFIHELGHYLVARLYKIEVEEFGFGFPPRLVKLFNFGNTEVTLNWIPFGAFVRPKGENNPEIAGGLAAAPPVARIATMLGGPMMNIVAGILIFSFLLQSLGAADTSKVKIMAVNAGSPAEQQGIKPGDVVVSINRTSITDMNQMIELVTAYKGKEILMTLQRADEILDIKITPRISPPEGEGAMGIQMGYATKPITYGEALLGSVRAVGEIARQMILLPYNLIQGQIAPDQARMVGPVGMYNIYDKAVQTDMQSTTTQNESLPFNTIYLIGMISIAIGFTNLLPFPALDGGRILFTLPELLFKRRVPPEYENMVHLVGFAALLMLMVYVTAQDIINPIVLP